MKRPYTRIKAGMTIKGVKLIEEIPEKRSHGCRMFRAICECKNRFITDTTKLRRNENIQCEECRSARNRRQIQYINRLNPKHNKAILEEHELHR